MTPICMYATGCIMSIYICGESILYKWRICFRHITFPLVFCHGKIRGSMRWKTHKSDTNVTFGSLNITVSAQILVWMNVKPLQKYASVVKCFYQLSNLDSWYQCKSMYLGFVFHSKLFPKPNGKSTGTGWWNDLAPNRHQSITSTSDDEVIRPRMALPRNNELSESAYPRLSAHKS